jgi:hypothetical protein
VIIPIVYSPVEFVTVDALSGGGGSGNGIQCVHGFSMGSRTPSHPPSTIPFAQ